MMYDSVTDIDWENWDFTERAVLCFINSTDQKSYLLIHKKRGLGQGKINAPGGRIEQGETIEEAVIRECQEEVGLTPKELSFAGVLNFIFQDNYSLKGYVYTANGYDGTEIETDEADPFWCLKNEIPYNNMWADDILWIPLMMSQDEFIGNFIFNNDTLISHSIQNVSRETLTGDATCMM